MGHMRAVAVVAILACASCVAVGCTSTDGERSTPTEVAPPHDCPGMIGDTLEGQTVADLRARGAADGLPYDGATTMERVEAALRINEAQIRSAYPEVISVTVGPGLGWTYSFVPGGTADYHHVSDYQIITLLRRDIDCPLDNAFVSNDQGERVPLLFQYLSTA